MKKGEKKIDVSVVIVCMNNLKNLIPCIDSLFKYTNRVTFEVIVVAYLFSKDNINVIQNKYKNIKLIKSDDVRGFSENNNLGLKAATGRYCMILNDDTIMQMPVIDLLEETFETISDASFISPMTIFESGEVQSCGRPPFKIATYVLGLIGLWKEQITKSKYVNQSGVFQTYNIAGAAFMVKTDVLKELGFFDERYFFCPEDIALSTKANKSGYKCYVNSDIHIMHLEGGSSKTIKEAIDPAIKKGMIIFYGDSILNKILISAIIFFELIIKYLICYIPFVDKYDEYQKKAIKNSLASVFTNATPKEIFLKYYNNKNIAK